METDKIKNMGITATEYVETYDPDVVIVMFNPNQLRTPKAISSVMG